MVSILSIDYVTDFVVLNTSCLSVECRGPLQEKHSRCCHFGQKAPRLIVGFEYREICRSPFCGKLSYRQHEAILAVSWRDFWGWHKACCAIHNRGDPRRRRCRQKMSTPREDRHLLRLSERIVSFRFLVWGCRWFGMLAGTWLSELL